MKTRVAVLAGGESDEIEVSLKSADTIIKNLPIDEFEIFSVIAEGNLWFVTYQGEKIKINKEDFSFIFENNKISFDIVYITIHGIPGENGAFQGYFDLIGQKYTGPNQWGSAITFNKWACNQLLSAFSFNVAESELHLSSEKALQSNLISTIDYPFFVKPNDSGSSFGVSKVNTIEEFGPAVKHAFKHGKEVIIERGLVGTEVTSGVYKTKEGEVKALPITEIVTENDFFDYEAKYQGKSQEITPARLDDSIQKLIQETSVEIYKKLNLNGVIRVDYIIENEYPFVIEINTTPGMSAASIIPQQAKAANIPLSEVLTASIYNSLK
jgi:D-alanine-D-alanine ligase